MANEDRHDGYEPVIGLEIHVQLATETKLFCGCPNRFGGEPNTRTCPVCLGLPGALPVLNRRAVRHAVRAALALGSEVQAESRFARKNYFYPDLPKGYQISQYALPLAEGGRVEFEKGGGEHAVRLVRLHLEEDAGKSIHDGMPRSGEATHVDLNRCGVPLVEIVTEPDLRAPAEAGAFLESLRRDLLFVGITDASMQEGSLRCDANVSVRPAGQESLEPKTEVKNLNSFRFLRRALAYEIERQVGILEGGGRLEQATRLWDERAGATVTMRTKEDARDYRYFPEPDLVPVRVDEAEIEAIRAEMPELPAARRARWIETHGIASDDADVLSEGPGRAAFFDAVLAAGAEPVLAARWLRGEVLGLLNERGETIEELGLEPEALAALLAAVADGTVSENSAGEVLDAMVDSGRTAEEIIAERDLEQISSAEELAPVVEEVLGSHPEEVAAYRSGRHRLFGFLMGQVMRATRGKANPEVARELLQSALERAPE